MCFIGCSLESLVFLLVVLFTILQSLYVLYGPFIIMFVITPLVYLMNDEETKGVIAEQNWYQGLKHMLGLHSESDE